MYGHTKIPFEYDTLILADHPFIKAGKDGLYSVINRFGRKLFPLELPEKDIVILWNRNRKEGWIKIRQKKRWHLIELTGQQRAFLNCEDIFLNRTGSFRVVQQGKAEMVDVEDSKIDWLVDWRRKFD